MTVSDTRDEQTDKSGKLLVEMLREAGHELADKAIVRDDVASIREKLRQWIDLPEVDVIITTGGTGLTGRDVTPEAVTPLFDKHIEGFATIFQLISYEKIGTSAMLSRACAGVAGTTYIFAIPGSSGACKDAWNGILHQQLDIRHKPCNFIEMMPRLGEK
jgi:molybdenum cofactor biosynthesis protein B